MTASRFIRVLEVKPLTSPRLDNSWTMPDKFTIVRRVLVEGAVQGVGYREFTRRTALRLNVSGWVRNRSDGRSRRWRAARLPPSKRSSPKCAKVRASRSSTI